MEAMNGPIADKILKIKRRMIIPDLMNHRIEKIFILMEITMVTMEDHEKNKETTKTIVIVKIEIMKEINLVTDYDEEYEEESH
jgi:hypothetical protein